MYLRKKACACRGGTLTKFLQPMILCLLDGGEDHGYRILKALAAKPGMGGDLDASGVYRTLKLMEERGLLCSHLGEDGDAAPQKRVYAVTDEGRKCMKNWHATLTDYQKQISAIITDLERCIRE